MTKCKQLCIHKRIYRYDELEPIYLKYITLVEIEKISAFDEDRAIYVNNQDYTDVREREDIVRGSNMISLMKKLGDGISDKVKN